MAAKASGFSTAKWLKEDLGFTDVQVQTLLPLFEPVRTKIEGGYLRQADYSKFMNDGKVELERLQGEIAAKDAQLTREMTEWASLQQGDERKATALRTELEQARLERFQLEQRIRTIAEEQGLDVTKILTTPTPPPPGAPGAPGAPPAQPPASPPSPDPNLVSREQFGSVVDYMLSLPAELAVLAQEHYALTGETLDARPIITELKARVTKKQPADLRQIWEEQHKISEKREAKTKAKYDADIKAAEDRGREAARSEAALPGQHPTGTHAPIFKQTAETGSRLQRPQPGQTTRGFAESLRSRKYAQGPAAQASTPGGTK